MYKIGFMPGGNMLSWEAEKMCAYVKNAGYDAIELQNSLVCADARSDADRKKLARAAESNGLIISQAGMQRDFVLADEGARNENIEYTIRNIPKLADMGVDIACLYSGPVPWASDPLIINRDMPASTAWDLLFDAFDRILPVAEKYKVRLSVENVFGMLCHDFFSHMHLNRHYGSPWLGVNLDPSHDVLYGNSDMKFLIDGWGKDRIFHAHLKDAVGVPEMGRFLFPLIGEGNVDWKTFFAEMEAIGYDGCMSVEFESFEYLKNVLGGRFEEAVGLSARLLSVWLDGKFS